MRNVAYLIASLLLAGSLIACSGGPPSRTDTAALADTMRESLREDILAHWYPRAIDSARGGYLSHFAYDWQPLQPQNKFIVTQARHVWTLARLHETMPRDDSLYLRAARHGVAFLRNEMWDPEYGGFHSLLSRAGTVKKGDGGYTATKTAYGNAFAIYGLTAHYTATGDTNALRLAQRAFQWLDAHGHDDTHGGYFRFLHRDGAPFVEGYEGEPPKGQNSSIHLLEAFTTLYEAAPDTPHLRDRLQELLTVVRDTMTRPRGALRLYYRRDWTPISYRDSSMAVREAHADLDHLSFGHDVETAFLMLEAAEALGRPRTPTLEVGKTMVDHALAHGWDAADGGLYEAGLAVGADSVRIVRSSKSWWAQAEALHSLFLMEREFPDDPHDYGAKARTMWRYIDRYLIDPTHGGWYVSGIDESPEARKEPKGTVWKGTYHNARALLRTAALLDGE